MSKPNTPRKIMIIAGETSGDRLAARAINHAKSLAAESGVELDLFGIGGERCKALGMKCYYHPTQMSVVGFWEVAKRYRFFRRVLREMIALLDDQQTRPDTILLVDYPGFNIPFAKAAKQRGIEVIYYVSPQVWAWKPSRVAKIVASVSRMLVIFPFEVEIYQKAGLVQTEFIGHPLVEILDEEQRSFVARTEFAERYGLDANKKWLLVMPGSRSEEVRRHLPLMSEAAAQLAEEMNWQPIIVESENIPNDAYDQPSNHTVRFRSSHDVHQLMSYAHLGILKSGTTTLEAAIAGLPGVICYRTSWVTYALARMLVKLKYIGLANIVLGKMLYPELLQHEMTPARIVAQLRTIDSNRASFADELNTIRTKLASDGSSPSLRVAHYMLGV